MSDLREKLADCVLEGIDKVHDMDVTHREYANAAADAIIAALPDMVEPLVWDIDSRRVTLDDTMMMGKGYDWEGYELMREEAHFWGISYAIWPDHIGSDVFSLYCTADGLYIQSLTKDDAKSAANAHRRPTILAAFGAQGETA